MAEIKKYPQCCERCGEIFEAESDKRYCEDCRKALDTVRAFKAKLRNAMIADLVCTRCGKKYTGNYTTGKYCPACREIVQKEYQREYRRKTIRPAPEPPQSPQPSRGKGKKAKPDESIVQCAKRAQELGISYGEYVAQKYYGGGPKK